MKTLITLAGCMFGFAGMCDAAQIASPAIYAAPSQDVANCVVYNGASIPQTVQLKLFDEAGIVIASGNCGAFSAGQFCNIVGGVAHDKAYACAATVTGGNITRLRGSIILQDNISHTSLLSAPLQ